MKTNCYKCKHKRSIPGDAHISCNKPDPYMEGNLNGIKYGWFNYPYNFDPCWIIKECANYEDK